MGKILKIDLKSQNAPIDFVKSLSESGFAVIENHNIDQDLIANTYKDWKIFFNSSIKKEYLFDLEKHILGKDVCFFYFQIIKFEYEIL